MITSGILVAPHQAGMDEHDNEDRVERKVVYENVSETTSRGSLVTIIVIAVIALGLVVFILMHLR